MVPRDSSVPLASRYVARHSKGAVALLPSPASTRLKPLARAGCRRAATKGYKGNKDETATKRTSARENSKKNTPLTDSRGGMSAGRGGVEARSYLFLHRKRAGTDVKLAVTRVAEHILQRRVERHTDGKVGSVRRAWL